MQSRWPFSRCRTKTPARDSMVRNLLRHWKLGVVVVQADVWPSIVLVQHGTAAAFAEAFGEPAVAMAMLPRVEAATMLAAAMGIVVHMAVAAVAIAFTVG